MFKWCVFHTEMVLLKMTITRIFNNRNKNALPGIIIIRVTRKLLSDTIYIVEKI